MINAVGLQIVRAGPVGSVITLKSTFEDFFETVIAAGFAFGRRVCLLRERIDKQAGGHHRSQRLVFPTWYGTAA